MSRHIVSLPFAGDRHFPPQTAGDFACALEASGAVDEILFWDQLTSWYPRSMWIPENTPLAKEGIGDCDSYYDPFVAAAFAAAQMKNKLEIGITSDAIRRAPAELLQTLLTLGGGLGKPATIQLGAGELKQTKPFGYKRKEGLERFEDIIKIIKALVDTEGLVSHEGQHWKYENAWIGGAKKFPPRIYALGGGPKLFELAVKYCDGISSVAPFAFVTPEDFEKLVKKLRDDLEREGRDPDKFAFGLWYAVMIDDGSNDLDAVIDNPLLKYWAAMSGRFDQRSWRKEGLEPVFPENFHYAMHLLPTLLSKAETDSIVARTPRDMVKKSFLIGNPREVASLVRDYAQAGANYHCIVDCAPVTRSMQRAPAQLTAQLDTCRILKTMIA